MGVMAQKNAFKNERRIYLWDVTLSMKGYQDKTPDIYDKVVAALEKDINSIKDEQSEIWVLPFQTKILDKWESKATTTGKKWLINKVKGFKNKDITNTDIASPLEWVMDELIKPDKRNVLILLTDGQQNVGSKNRLLDLIRKWCEFAEENDAHAFYVMLTKFAQDEELIRVIDETCRISNIIMSEDSISVNFVELLPQSNYKYNIKDDVGKELMLQINSKKQVEIPKNLKIKCLCEPNPYVEVGQTATIEDGMIKVDIKYIQSYDSLKTSLPIDYNEKIMLHFEVDNPQKYPFVQLLNEECCLELINKPEKILKVYVKD